MQVYAIDCSYALEAKCSFIICSGRSRIARWGGHRAVGGWGADLQRGCFSVKTNVKTKELDPVGGGARRQRPPGSANDMQYKW